MYSNPLNTIKSASPLSGYPDLSCFYGYPSGFNGQERDDELAGVGNFNTALYWEYDTRLGRRWNVDPKLNASNSVYSTFNNNPIYYYDLLGDTVSRQGFSAKKIVKDLGKGLNVKKGENPYSFDKNGHLREDKSKYEALSDDQKKVADNINETISSDINFIITKGKPSQVLGKNEYKKVITLYDVGGAATVGDTKDYLCTVRVWMDGETLTGTDRPTDKNGTHLKTPTWLTLFHELGGHGVHRYLRNESRDQQNVNTVIYENLVRKLHNLGERYKHD